MCDPYVYFGKPQNKINEYSTVPRHFSSFSRRKIDRKKKKFVTMIALTMSGSPCMNNEPNRFIVVKYILDIGCMTHIHLPLATNHHLYIVLYKYFSGRKTFFSMKNDDTKMSTSNIYNDQSHILWILLSTVVSSIRQF